MLRQKTQKKSDRIPLVITYDGFLSNITKTIWKNWNILQINKNLKEIFKSEPITAFKRNKKIQEIIGRHWIENERVNKNLKTLKEGKIKSWKYMLQTSENYNKIQEPTKKKTKIRRYFTIQTVRQNIPFILWSA